MRRALHVVGALSLIGALMLSLALGFSSGADAELGDEISLSMLLTAALERPGLSSDEIDEAKRQARRSGALPRLTVRTRRIWKDVKRAEELAQGPRTRVDVDDNLLLEAQIQFDLGRLIYGADAIAWAREAREREHRRAIRSREIVQLYYERRRLLFELSTMHRPDTEYELRIVEIEALLDALTGGALSKARYRRPPSRPEADVQGIHPAASLSREAPLPHSENRSAIARVKEVQRSESAISPSKEGIEERIAAPEEEAMDEHAHEGQRRRRKEEGAGD